MEVKMTQTIQITVNNQSFKTSVIYYLSDNGFKYGIDYRLGISPDNNHISAYTMNKKEKLFDFEQK